MGDRPNWRNMRVGSDILDRVLSSPEVARAAVDRCGRLAVNDRDRAETVLLAGLRALGVGNG